MRRYSTTYFIGESIKGLWKNGVMTAASVLVLLSCLVVMGAFSTLVMNINKNLESLGVLNEIVAFIDADKTEDEISDMYKSVLGFDGVDKVEYCSRADALAQEKKKYEEAGYPYLAESLNEENNPFHATLTVSYKADASVEDLQNKIKNTDGIYKVNCRADIAETITKLRSSVSLVLLWFMITLFVVSFFVIVNTVKLSVYSRRQEIMVMRYIGATKNFITVPFIIEGMLIGLVSGGLAYAIERLLYTRISDSIKLDNIISIIPFSDISLMMIAGFLAIGVVTGVIGSCISLRKYLKT